MRASRLRKGTATYEDLLFYIKRGNLRRVALVAQWPELNDRLFGEILKRVEGIERYEIHAGREVIAWLSIRSDLGHWRIARLLESRFKEHSLGALLQNPDVDRQLLARVATETLRAPDVPNPHRMCEALAGSSIMTAEMAYLIYNLQTLTLTETQLHERKGLSLGCLATLAANPQTPPDILQRLSESMYVHLAQAALSNPSFAHADLMKKPLRELTRKNMALVAAEITPRQLMVLNELPRGMMLGEALERVRGQKAQPSGIKRQKVAMAPEPPLLAIDEGAPYLTFLKDSKKRFNTAIRLTETLSTYLKLHASQEVASSLDIAASATDELFNFYQSLLEVEKSQQTIRALAAVQLKLEDSLDSYEAVVDALLSINDRKDFTSTEESLEVVLSQVKGWSEVKDISKLRLEGVNL